MELSTLHHFLLPTLILIVSVIEDVRTRKVRNKTVLITLGITFIAVFLLSGWSGLQVGLLGFFTALLVMLPLVLVKVVGAGDMKIYTAFGLATDWQSAVYVAVIALFCGALLGLVRSILQGNIVTLLRNMVEIFSLKKVQTISNEQLTRIPYTVALLLGWFVYLNLQHYGYRIW